MLSWLKSSIYPETVETAKVPERVVVDKALLDKLVENSKKLQEHLQHLHDDTIERQAALVQMQGTMTDAQKKLFSPEQQEKLQKLIDNEAVGIKKQFGINHVDIPSNDLPLPRIWDKDTSKLLITIDEGSTLTIDIAAAKTFYALSMTHDASTSEAEHYCTLQIKDTEGEFSFGFPMINEGIAQALAWFHELDRLLKTA